jgi:cell fate regulator YaaT (PSP1 superfamily)
MTEEINNYPNPGPPPGDPLPANAICCEGVGRVSLFARVEFKGNRRLLFSNPMEFLLRVGDLVIVQVEKGEDLGRIVCLLPHLPESVPAPQFPILRCATAKDIALQKDYRLRESQARTICLEKISRHGLEMKLVDVEYQFDGRKLTFYFTADGRVDFRQLVKDLAAAFRTRIELRQIGTRDETRRFSGAGPCGRLLCCSSFISEFCPITTQMAKDQNLPLNPAKISGCCGRLKCCLGYEIDLYRETLRSLPRWDSRLETIEGSALVETVDIFNCTVTLRFSSGEQTTLDCDQLTKILKPGFKLPLLLPEHKEEEEETASDILPDFEDEYPYNPS